MLAETEVFFSWPNQNIPYITMFIKVSKNTDLQIKGILLGYSTSFISYGKRGCDLPGLGLGCLTPL